MADLHFTENFIAVTPEKKYQFEIFLRTELGGIINEPAMGWKIEALMVDQWTQRYQQTLEFILAYAKLEDLEFTGELAFVTDNNGRGVIKAGNITFLKEDKFLSG